MISSPSRLPAGTPLSRFLLIRELGLVAAILVVIGVILLLDPERNFLSPYNRERLLHHFSLLGVFAIGEAVVIIAGGIDLSPGAVIGFTGVVCAMLLTRLGADVPAGEPLSYGIIAAAVGLTLIVGLLIGLFHSFLITKLELPPFVATLGTLAGLRSAARILSNSSPIPISDTRFRALGDNWWVTLIIFLVLAILIAWMMNRSRIGRQIYAMGGNEAATHLSGVRVNYLKTVAYCTSALLATLAGILYVAYLGEGRAETGMGYELNAVAAAVVGGCSLLGGVGSTMGTALGVALLVIVINGTGLIIKQDSSLWEGIIVGAVVILAVAVNRIRILKRR